MACLKQKMCIPSGPVDGKIAVNGEWRRAPRRPDHMKPPPNPPEDEDAENGEMLVEQLKSSLQCNSILMETFSFAGKEIRIQESLDTFGAITWPGAVALCEYLQTNREHVNLQDKAVLELGSGTGLLAIVASLLGAWVTATDLPDILSNLTFNLFRNTRGCRYTPQVAELTWGHDLDQKFPHSVYRYDYVVCADVVYTHEHLDELLLTMRHFCRPGTTLLWANKVRFPSDLRFTENFKNAFSTTLVLERPLEELRIYQATVKP